MYKEPGFNPNEQLKNQLVDSLIAFVAVAMPILTFTAVVRSFFNGFQPIIVVLTLSSFLFAYIHFQRGKITRQTKLLVLIAVTSIASLFSYMAYFEIARIYMIMLLPVVTVACGTRPLFSYIFSLLASIYGLVLSGAISQSVEVLKLNLPLFALSLTMYLMISYLLSSKMVDQLRRVTHIEWQANRTDNDTGLLNELALKEIFGRWLRSDPHAVTRLYLVRFGCLVSTDTDFSREVRDHLRHQIGLMFKLNENPLIAFGVLNDGNFLIIANRANWVEIESFMRSLNEASLAVDGYKVLLNPVVVTTDTPSDGTSFTILLDNLTRVLDRADIDNLRFARYTPVDRPATEKAHYYASELKSALEKGQLKLFLQPKVLASDVSKIKGCEALIRWEHPEAGLLTPASFLEQVEKSTGRAALALFVIDQSAALLQQAQLIDPDFQLSFNLNPADLHDLCVIAHLARIMKAYDFAPNTLQIEVTESETAMHVDILSRSLSAIKSLGYSIAMDDFGTGMSSLSYFSKLPVDTVKIDRAFLESIETSKTAVHVLHSMINLCKGVDWQVVVEGVETQSQASIVKELGVDTIQGYRFGKAIDANRFMETLHDKNQANDLI